ncbi:MAG: hypothetical protein AAF441_28065 [Pseudomonadota bacterium]
MTVNKVTFLNNIERIFKHFSNSLNDRFDWRVRPTAFLRELLMLLDEKHRWVNLSDGGHIENLAGMELLRRRCRFIIIGDGEADPNLHFNGLARLIQFARIDLGVEIVIDLEELRLNKLRRSTKHYAIGNIYYPRDGDIPPEIGQLIYLKSSFTGDEDEMIQEYRNRKPAFPHESTADQMFEEDQFEAYHSLGQHIASTALEDLKLGSEDGNLKYGTLEKQILARRPPDRSVQKRTRLDRAVKAAKKAENEVIVRTAGELTSEDGREAGTRAGEGDGTGMEAPDT